MFITKHENIECFASEWAFQWVQSKRWPIHIFSSLVQCVWFTPLLVLNGPVRRELAYGLSSSINKSMTLIVLWSCTYKHLTELVPCRTKVRHEEAESVWTDDARCKQSKLINEVPLRPMPLFRYTFHIICLYNYCVAEFNIPPDAALCCIMTRILESSVLVRHTLAVVCRL